MKTTNGTTIKITAEELRSICKEYEYDDDVMNDEDERIHRLKKAMSLLDRSDYIIICLYAHFQSERKVAECLGCSRTPISRILKEIRGKIKALMGEEKN